MTDPDHAASPRIDITPTAFRARQDMLMRALQQLPWLILVIGLTVTTLILEQWRRQHIEGRREEFRTQVSKVRTSIESRIKANEQILRGVAGLFAVNEHISREQFHTYVESLRLKERYPGTQGVGFSLRIAPTDMDAHVRAIRNEGFTDYAPHPAGEREIHTAVVYLEPFDWRNQRAFGYDMFFEPVRRAAMTRAWDQGRAAISGKVRLLQETAHDVQAGFLIYVPIYRRGLPHDTPEERRANLLGWAYSPLRMKDLMESLLRQDYPELTERISIEIHDGTSVSNTRLMFDSAPGTDPTAGSVQEIQSMDPSGHPWTLRAHSLPAFDHDIRRAAGKDWMIFGAGGLLSASLALLAWVLIGTHLRVAAALRQTALAHRELSESQQRLRLIFDTSDVAIFLTDMEGRITQANVRMAEMFRCPMDRLIGSDYVTHIHPSERDIGRRKMLVLMSRQTAEASLERRYWREDGTEFWGHLGGRRLQDDDGRPIGLVGVISDITHRKEAEEKIHFLAHHDYLTGLPNRALFVERVNQSLAVAQRYRRPLALLFLDLDDFKPINDRLGHQAGDLVLREVAKRLREHVRASDTVCRQGGDEFVILVPEFPDRDHLEQLIQTLSAMINQPFEVMGATLDIRVSIGIAIYPEHGETTDELMHSADAAMYLAKDAARQARFDEDRALSRTLKQTDSS